MKLKLVRTPDQLRAARQVLGLSAEALAAMVRMGDGRTVRRWEAGENEIPGPVTVVLETALDFLQQRDDISLQLERLREETMRPMSIQFGGNGWQDNTEETIGRLEAAKSSLEDAVAILTRRPLTDGSQANKVHWYNLTKLNPAHGEKDRWSLPGETSPEAALAYFVKELGLPQNLVVCDAADLAAEYLLEKCIVQNTPSPSGAAQRLRAGDAIEVLGVKGSQCETR
jgi:hypothetical protein